MIAGLSGDLVSQAFAEELLLATNDRHRGDFERRAVRWWRSASRALGPASSARAVLDTAVIPLLHLLGHDRPAMTPEAFGFSALLPAARSVLIALPWQSSAASSWREGVTRGASAGARWVLICTGRSLRIVDGSRPWSRAALQFDFDRLFLSAAGVAALWTFARAPVLAATDAASLSAHVDASDRHAVAVCRSLGNGVLRSLPPLARDLANPTTSGARTRAALDQALTLVYRVLFLLFAEARGLVPVWNDIYREGYSIDALVGRAARAGAPGLWKALQAICRLAHSGCHAGDLTVTAFNGRLFSPRFTPLIERSRVPDTVARDLLLSLATESTRSGRRRISYFDLGVEQLGSVYERVLEYQPARRGNDVVLERTSTERKATGSFYTPQALTDHLVRRTLAPLVKGRNADEILSLRILDPAMGSGAFLVAACRYLAECCEQAKVQAGEWRDNDIHERDRATLRRAVAERCLYGVDLNPTAVQLARVSLWLTTLAADRPLTFLDHHLASGNSLIGASLADLTHPPPRARRPAAALPLLDEAFAHDVGDRVIPARLQIALDPSDSLDAVRLKERLLAALGADTGPLAKWQMAADAWCAAALWTGPDRPSNGLVHEWMAASTGGVTTVPDTQLRKSIDRAIAVAAAHRPFHWELAFPEVFFDATGRGATSPGFDAVIGNPPWDMIRADTGTAAQREQARSMTTAAARFYRASRAYETAGSGHANSYQRFVERALQLTRPGGRIGLLLPSGIGTDHGSAALRRRLLDRTTVDTWIGFDNRKRIFPIHRSVRFVLLTTTNGGTTNQLRMRCGLDDASRLDDGAAANMVTVSHHRLRAWDPEHLAIPEIPTPASLAILASIADRVPVLSDQHGWHARFGRELNATDDRHHFRRREAQLLPIVEGKQLAPFQLDLARSTQGIAREVASTLLDPNASFDRPRIAYRDVASATNKLTLIAALLPEGVVSTHTLHCLKNALDELSQWCLLALMNSLVANYLVRMRVTTHVTTSLMSRVPVPRPQPRSAEFQRLVQLAQSLAVSGIADPSGDYAELNAIAARLYGVSRAQYALVLDSFPLIAAAQRDLCLRAF